MKKRVLQIACILLALATVIVVVIFHDKTGKKHGTYADGIEEIDPNTIALADGKTRISFSEVILSQPKETRKLVVYEQEATVTATIEKSKIKGINLKAIQQNQNVTYTATGHFIVNLDQLTKDNIVDDVENKTLTIKIDHPVLDSISIDPNQIEIGKQDNGILAFGDLALKVSDYVDLEKELQKKLQDKLDTSANGQQADDIALKMVQSIYAPVVRAVDEDYTLKVEFK